MECLEIPKITVIKDLAWIRQVSKVQVMIEEYGMFNFLGSVVAAIENEEKELAEESEDFAESQHHKNIIYQKEVMKQVMNVVDLDSVYGNSEARRISLDRFKDNIEGLEDYV